jgi:hypothetical protein
VNLPKRRPREKHVARGCIFLGAASARETPKFWKELVKNKTTYSTYKNLRLVWSRD